MPDRRSRPVAGAIFVVHEHAATNHHWDFRLEVGGVLRSWAVPKGPTLDPKAKRLAVAVPDPPLCYGSWEGIIPAGSYGAGPVVVWDTGAFAPHGDAAEGLGKGRLGFTLHGRRLKGDFSIVRFARAGERQWLLHKTDDGEAVPGWEPPTDLTDERIATLKEEEPPCSVE
jgi:bifunctional non-homologous end joining protein LigD